MRKQLDEMRTERDFYLSKLRALEILSVNVAGDDGDGVGANAAVVQQYTLQSFGGDVLRILYAKE